MLALMLKNETVQAQSRYWFLSYDSFPHDTEFHIQRFFNICHLVILSPSNVIDWPACPPSEHTQSKSEKLSMWCWWAKIQQVNVQVLPLLDQGHSMYIQKDRGTTLLSCSTPQSLVQHLPVNQSLLSYWHPT